MMTPQDAAELERITREAYYLKVGQQLDPKDRSEGRYLAEIALLQRTAEAYQSQVMFLLNLRRLQFDVSEGKSELIKTLQEANDAMRKRNVEMENQLAKLLAAASRRQAQNPTDEQIAKGFDEVRSMVGGLHLVP